jgi:hypothetical protein
MPRAVLDVDVLVSALISPAGAPARLLVELRAGAFEVVISPLLLAELREVLARPRFRAWVSVEDAAAFVTVIELDAMLFEDPPPTDGGGVADPDDQYLIDLARVARADALVTGDARLLDRRGQLPIVTPRQFLDSLDDR